MNGYWWGEANITQTNNYIRILNQQNLSSARIIVHVNDLCYAITEH